LPVGAPLPTITLPLEGRKRIALVSGATLLTPRFGDAAGHSRSKVFVRTPTAIEAYDPRTATRLWSAEAPVKAEGELLISREDVTVFATLYEIVAFDSRSGGRGWTVGRRPDHAGDPGADWEQGGAFRNHALDGDLLVSVRDNGEVTAVSLTGGKVLWRQRHSPPAFGKICIAEPWVVYHIVQDGNAALVALDASTGSLQGTILTEESRPVEDLYVTIEGWAVLVSSRSLRGFDLHSRTEKWEQQLAGQVRPGSIAIDDAAIYVSDNGLDVQTFRLADGHQVWQSERIAERGVDDLIVQLTDKSLLASTSSSIVAIDVETGLRQWEATLAERPRLEYRLLTDRYAAAVDTGGEIREQPTFLYFYDHAGGGVIPKGGGIEVGPLGKIRAVMALDGAVVIEADGALNIFTTN